MTERALITGGAGFLGRHLCRRLAEEGVSVTALDDLSSRNADLGAPELEHPLIQRYEGSALDRRLMRRLLIDHELVVHFASVVGVEETIRRTTSTVRNLKGAIILRELLTPDHVILFASSADVYGMHSRMYERPMREDDYQLFEASSVNRWVYPKVKSLEENLIGESAARSVNVRIFNSFGPGMDYPHARRVIPEFMTNVFAQQPLSISGSGKQIRTFCYCDDTVRGVVLAIKHAIEQRPPYNLTVNIGADQPVSIIELAGYITSVAVELGVIDKPLPILKNAKLYSQHFEDSWSRVPDLSRAKAVLGYEPRVSLIEGLRRTFIHFAHMTASAVAPNRRQLHRQGPNVTRRAA